MGGRFASDGEAEEFFIGQRRRRVGEKIGRFLVALNEDKGMAHNGLPCLIEPFDLVPVRSAFVDTVPSRRIPVMLCLPAWK